MDPLPELSGKQEVAETANHTLETFYPVSPTIDLQKVQVYQEGVNSTGKKRQIWPLRTGWFKALKLHDATLSGFTADYSYPYPHTLYFLEGIDDNCKLQPEQFRAKMLMFAFGNALACAHKLYGVRFCSKWWLSACASSSNRSNCHFLCFVALCWAQAQPQHSLDRPVTVQAVGTNGRIFQFLVFQLNTTKLEEDDGIKNQVMFFELCVFLDVLKTDFLSVIM